MPDREKVIKSLKWFRDRDKWREGIMIHDDHAEVRKQICDNAIELLKEQEPKAGHWNGFPNHGVYDYRCSECGLILTLGMPHSKFCPGCGAKMDLTS